MGWIVAYTQRSNEITQLGERYIMITFHELKRQAREAKQKPTVGKLAILGDCATQLLATAIKGYGYAHGLNLDIFDADYNQIEVQVIDAGSELYRFAPDHILLFMCTEKLYECFCETKPSDRGKFAEVAFRKIKGHWDSILSQRVVHILQYSFVEKDDGIWGNFSSKREDSFLFQLRKLNLLMMEGAQQNKSVFLLDLNAIQRQMGSGVFFDEKYYYSAKTPISLTAMPLAAKQVIDVLDALRGRVKKCVILDLDNTLWGGVIGDDGLSGIEIGELGAGHAFSEFQMWLRELRRRGVLLAVCSKNNEDTAKEPFEKHPDMVLRLSDISMFVANWQDKASNIRVIQQTLNIGMDSMVFLDDNPFERELVRSLIPEITVPELPEDPALYCTVLKQMNLFETASFSAEDAVRTEQYQAEAGRVALQKQFHSMDEYLMSLEMRAEVKPFDAFHYPRIAQLTQRSNQFNLRTVRYTEEDIGRIAEDEDYLTLYFTLRDKFGSHGLISVVILQKEGDTLFVNTWLMSCRVLKRGMEEFIANSIMRLAKEKGFRCVVGEYLQTPKNRMVEHLYEQLGFVPLGGGRYEMAAENYVPQKTYIVEG